jgi:hypothetical protein
MRKLQHQPQDALQLQVVGVFPEHIDFNYSSWKGRVSGNGNNLSKSSWNIALSGHA